MPIYIGVSLMRIELEDHNACVTVKADIGPMITDVLQYIIIPALMALGYQHDTINEHVRPEGFDD